MGIAETEPAVGTAFFGEFAVGGVGFVRTDITEAFEQGGAVEGFRIHVSAFLLVSDDLNGFFGIFPDSSWACCG